MIGASRVKLMLALLFATSLLVLALPQEVHAQPAPRQVANCVACHGELELLRQHVPSPARARELLVTLDMMRGTGHDNLGCAECHTGYATFPHAAARTSTATCASCHQEADTDWEAGQHAIQDDAGTIAAPCASCHGVHDVATADQLAEAPARHAMNSQCVACHQTEALPALDPHAREVGCWTCHSPHRVHAVDDPLALVAPAQQARTCGVCHDTAFANWSSDAHGIALQQALATPGTVHVLPLTRESPTCTGCHGGHGMLAVADETFPNDAVARCSDCHEHHADTYFGTYHGKATALGSRIAASCADCHGAHQVFAQDDPRSMVHAGNLIQTCAECHPHARPAFVRYDSHPELGNWQRNPILTASFYFMNSLLIFVLLVFGAHTALWWVRLVIDKRRGIMHGPGMHGGHGHGGHGSQHGQGPGSHTERDG
jgi:hypothetical protein